MLHFAHHPHVLVSVATADDLLCKSEPQVQYLSRVNICIVHDFEHRPRALVKANPNPGPIHRSARGTE
jgi:hypothetical protein